MFTEQPCKLRPVEIAAVCRDQDLRRVTGKHCKRLCTGFSACPHQLQMLHPAKLRPQRRQPLHELPVQTLPVLHQLTDARVHPGHQHIARAAALIDPQKAAEPPAVDARPLHVQQGRLRQGRERLVHTVDHQIRAAPKRRLREKRMHREMCAVRLIDNQGRACIMDNLRNRADIRDDTVIRRRCDQDRSDIRMPLQGILDRLRRNTSVNQPRRVCRRVQIRYPQAIQPGRMIRCLMTVARHQNMASTSRAGRHGSQDPARAAVHQVIRLFRSIKPCRPELSLTQDIFRMEQIVKTVYLRDINLIWITEKTGPPLVPGHMQRIKIGLPVLFKLLQQILFHQSQRLQNAGHP